MSISGDGKILLQEENDKINYTISKKNFLKFDTSLEINKNPVIFKFLNFQKEDGSKLNIKIKGFYEQDRLMKTNSLIIKEKKNEFKINDLTFDKRFKIKN